MEEEVNLVVGLDIGTTKIVAVVGYRDKATGKVRILGYGKTESVGVARGSVVNIQRVTESIKAAVEIAQDNANVDITEVYVGIAGQHIQSRPHDSSFIRPNNGEDLITREEIEARKNEIRAAKVEDGKVIIHVIPQTYTVDGLADIREDDLIGMTGSHVEVTYNIITADASAMRNIKRCVKEAGLELKGFILEPLVSAEAVLSAADKDVGVVLVDIGGGTTDMAVFNNGILRHTSVIPLAGNAITADIRTGCNIIPRQAEVLKIKYGSALPSEETDEQIVSIPMPTTKAVREISLKQLAIIIRARLDEIFGQVSQEIETSGCDVDNFIGGIVLTGGGSKLKYVDKVCEYLTRCETRLASPDIHLTDDSPKEMADPIFATAVGLVIYGINSEEEEALMAGEPEKEEKPALPVKEAETPLPVDENPGDVTAEETEGKKRGRKGRGGARPGFLDMGKLKDWVVNIFNDDVQ